LAGSTLQFVGILPSDICSIEPELSMRSSTFGSGGLMSICARAGTASAVVASAASSQREARSTVRS
jgi:hypothetical protein